MDIFFISFKENNCEANWHRLLEFHPNAKRIHGVKGIDQVHLACDTLSTTNYFWTVDGDNWLTEFLQYDGDVDDLVMFKAIDPLHDTPTLLGGVKIWRKGSIINPSMSKGDFSLNATAKKQIVDKCYSITAYNTSAYDTWKTSFRHCVKLMSMIFRDRPNARNINFYLDQWQACETSNKPFAEWAYQGYLDAKDYANRHDGDIDQLNNINNYEWLQLFFGNLHGTH